MVDTVKAHTGGRRGWERAGADIVVADGLLVVTQTKAVHDEIARLLDRLRR